MQPEHVRDKLIFEVVAGSRAYGTDTPESDLDLRGVFMLPRSDFLGLATPVPQVSDGKNDTTYWELRRYFELASKCNPNIIEVLWTPPDCIRLCTPVMEHLLAHRDLFLSAKAMHTFSGYARSQVKRARGRNKWVNNPHPELPPAKTDFCWFVDVAEVGMRWAARRRGAVFPDDEMPCRPVPLSEAGIDLSRHHAAKMEHAGHVYRLYDCGGDAKGVFRGDDEQLAVESIPLEDEWPRFAGLLIYNEDAYESARKNWKQYWEWRRNRNEARYRTQEAGEIDYDAKNLLHCMRLLWSGRNLLEHGEPIVRFEGERLRMLRDIRAGRWAYDDLMVRIEAEMRQIEALKETSVLPREVDREALDALYRELCQMQDGDR